MPMSCAPPVRQHFARCPDFSEKAALDMNHPVKRSVSKKSGARSERQSGMDCLSPVFLLT